jgi:hypothetical protein
MLHKLFFLKQAKYRASVKIAEIVFRKVTAPEFGQAVQRPLNSLKFDR